MAELRWVTISGAPSRAISTAWACRSVWSEAPPNARATASAFPVATEPYAPVMPAYVIAETDVHDPEQYERYQAASPGAIAAGGGRFIARGGDLVVLEGAWQPKRLVLLEFEDLEAVRRWYDSPEYREARRLREGAATLRVVAVEGL